MYAEQGQVILSLNDILFRGGIEKQAIDNGHVSQLKSIFRNRFAQTLLCEVVDMAAAVFVVLTSTAIGHVNTIQVKKNEKGAKKKIIGDGDKEYAIIFQDTMNFPQYVRDI